MSRSVDLWVGDTDDTKVPPRVRLRVFERCDGRCHRCSRKIRPGEGWTLEHLIALVNGGRNAEDNLSVTCDWCLPAKNAEDAAIKKRGTAVRYRHNGIKPERPKMQSRGFPKFNRRHEATRPIHRKSEQP